MKLFLILILVCGFSVAQDSGSLEIPKDKLEYFSVDPTPGMVYKTKCDICGGMAPTSCTVSINIGHPLGNKIINKANELYMAPYKTECTICLKCIFKALGVKPEIQEVK